MSAQAQSEPPPPPPRKPGSLLPERPHLAPGVKLTGQMQESAFKNPPWMIEKEDGRFMQVTPLLFKVAKLCTGENTVEDIAARLTEDGTPIQPETVKRLVGQMLIPQGIVLTADGQVMSLHKHSSMSPLTLSMRMKMLSPDLIEPITGVLQYLFWPPLLIALLISALGLQWWVFFQRGIAGPIHDALYRPASLLILLGIVVASAAFHEFGHASGLRYGGGKVRGMGVGLYLVYPVVYTDVTDEYRLKRWGKVRTDLGGFYFNLIFTLGIGALYFLTRQPFLLVSILLTDLEIVQQLMPFTRLDGYWILADLTGIPDFFSNLVPFVRTELHLEGPHVPPLKDWARVVFALYIVITVPLLALLIFLMIKSVPRVLATAWSSFGQQAHTFMTAQGHGNGLGMVLAAVAVIGLAIPTVGLFLALYRFGKMGTGLLWKWSAGSKPKRAAASAATAGAAIFVIFLWLPQIPFTHSRGPLYARASFRPIGSHETGTIHDAVPLIPGPAPSRKARIVTTPRPHPATATPRTRIPGAAISTPATPAKARRTGTPAAAVLTAGTPIPPTVTVAPEATIPPTVTAAPEATVTPAVTLPPATVESTPPAAYPTAAPVTTPAAPAVTPTYAP